MLFTGASSTSILYPRIDEMMRSFVNYTKVIIDKGVVKYSPVSLLVDMAIKQFEDGNVKEAYRTLIYTNFIVEKVQRYFFVEVISSLLIIILLLSYILVVLQRIKVCLCLVTSSYECS